MNFNGQASYFLYGDQSEKLSGNLNPQHFDKSAIGPQQIVQQIHDRDRTANRTNGA